MSEYVTNTTPEEVAAAIRSAGSIALATHAKPDGDALGSLLALARALGDEGREVRPCIVPPLTPPLAQTVGRTPIERVTEPPDFEPDLILVCDTGARSQLGPLAAWIEERREKTIVLDHHVHGDDVAARRIVDPTAASATIIVGRVLRAMGAEMTGGPFGVAEALLMGVATDTGWFRFKSAGPEAFRFAADLMEAGANKNRLYTLIEESDRLERLLLTQRALASLEFIGDGRVALMRVGPADFDETGGSREEVGGLVNLPLGLREVAVSIFLSSEEKNETKVSFRSKPPREGEPESSFVDVNELAQRLGGGGHVHAAGARLAMPIERATKEIRRAVREFLARQPEPNAAEANST